MVRHPEVIRAKVAILREQGLSKAEVRHSMQVSQNFVDRWWDAGQRDMPLHDKPRAGRPHKLSPRLHATIVKLSTGPNQISSNEVAEMLNAEQTEELPDGISVWTVRRELHREGLAAYHKRPKPPLNDQRKAKRRKFAREHKDDDFSNSVLIDEKRWQPYEKGNRKNDVYWAYSVDQVPDMEVLPQAKSFNTIDAISVHGPLPLVIVDGTINGSVFTNHLSSTILPAAERLFQRQAYRVIQDNAPPHRAKDSQALLRKKSPSFITAKEFPPYSPDLDVMDNLWSILLRRVQKQKWPTTKQLKKEVLKQWSLVTPEECENLILSMNKRLRAVLTSGGGSTKY
jgi:transposase